MIRRRQVAFVLLMAGLAVPSAMSSRQPEVRRTVLQRNDLSMSNREAVVAIAEIPPGGQTGRHTHPGEEVSYVLEGTIVLEVDGAQPVTLNAGAPAFIAAGRTHNARNPGSASARVLATYVVEKGQPVTTPR